MLQSDFYGNTYKWFVGVVRIVENNRVKVRIFGIHHMEDTVNVSDDDLPWATVAYPIDSTTDGMFLEPDHWVHGFFADGEDCQQPVITHKIGYASGSGYETGSLTYRSHSDGPEAQPGTFVESKYDKAIPGDGNVQKAFNFLTSKLVEEKGIPIQKAKYLAAGAVGSMQGESGQNLNPGLWGDGGTSYGIAQWHRANKRNDRLTPLESKYGVNNKSLTDQLNYLWWELNTREKGAYQKWIAATDVRDAAKKWTTHFERPRNPTSKGRVRAGYAANVLKQTGSNYQPLLRPGQSDILNQRSLTQ
jgi:hypothetical protein